MGETNLVYLHKYKTTPSSQPCRFEEGTYQLVYTTEGVPIAMKQSGHQFLLDYCGHGCRLLFANMRPGQVQIEGVFFARGSGAWNALMENNADLLALSDPSGITLSLGESHIEDINQAIVEGFRTYLSELRRGERRIVVGEHGLEPDDAGDMLFARHLLYEHVLMNGAFVSLRVDQFPWAHLPVGTDVTRPVVQLLHETLFPLQTFYPKAQADELQVLINRCPYCGSRKALARVDNLGVVRRLTTSEYNVANRYLKENQSHFDEIVTLRVATRDSCGCDR